MSTVDNLDIKTYNKIIQKYKKNKDVNVCLLMSTEMEMPKGCCGLFMYCCCYCLIHETVNDYINRRCHAIEDLLFKKYPGKNMDELMDYLKQALDVIKKHKINLYDVRNRMEHIQLRYTNVTSDEVRIITQAMYMLNPVVYIL